MDWILQRNWIPTGLCLFGALMNVPFMVIGFLNDFRDGTLSLACFGFCILCAAKCIYDRREMDRRWKYFLKWGFSLDSGVHHE